MKLSFPDCFCYGARTILRNFCISSSGHGASVEKYTIEKIKKTVGLSRDRLIIMAILLGCDFFGGVPGNNVYIFENRHQHRFSPNII